MKIKYWNIISLLAALALLVAGCGPAATTAAPKFKFALVTPNPRGDRSFIDASIRGADQAIADLGVAGTIVESASLAEQEAAMRSAISGGYDLVLALAIEPTTLVPLAEEFPNQKFGVPSDIFEPTLPPNVAAFQINVHEGSFLVGVVAGMLSQSKTVGAVVGGDNGGLNQFYYAYKQGVLAACPDCEVLVAYLGFDFSNPTLGKETAVGMYEQGADIIFQVAGRSGEGVIAAAQEKGLYAIGVDSNQDDIAPGSVIVSMIKRVDTGVFLLVKNTMEGNFKSGFSIIGMKEGATGLSWDTGSTTFETKGPAELTAKLPEVKTKVEEYRAQILAGTLEVCDALKETAVCEPLKPAP